MSALSQQQQVTFEPLPTYMRNRGFAEDRTIDLAAMRAVVDGAFAGKAPKVVPKGPASAATVPVLFGQLPFCLTQDQLRDFIFFTTGVLVTSVRSTSKSRPTGAMVVDVAAANDAKLLVAFHHRVLFNEDASVSIVDEDAGEHLVAWCASMREYKKEHNVSHSRAHSGKPISVEYATPLRSQQRLQQRTAGTVTVPAAADFTLPLMWAAASIDTNADVEVYDKVASPLTFSVTASAYG